MLVVVGQSVDRRGGMVVDGIARSRVRFAPGEVDALALVSRVRSHHGHSVVASSQEHTQSVQFALYRRIPLLGLNMFVHGVIRPRRLKLLCWHHDSSVFSFFQFGAFFS